MIRRRRRLDPARRRGGPVTEPLTPDRLDALEAAARRATSGPWRTGRTVGRTLYRQLGADATKGDWLIGMMDERVDAEFIAAADPATVLALIEAARAHWGEQGPTS